MKALLLAAGRGKRLGSVSDSSNKCMLEVAGKPILESNLDRAVTLDVDEIVLVVGHRAEDIVNRYGTAYKGKSIRYAIQPEQQGLVHAIESARNAIGSDDFFLLLGDEVLLNSRHRQMVDAFLREGVFAMCGVVFQNDKARIGRTYTVLVDDTNRVRTAISTLGRLESAS